MDESTAPLPVKFRFLHPVWQEHACAYATEHSAGLDLRACFDAPSLTVPAGGRAMIGTGVAIEITEPGFAGFVFSRSGLGAKDGLAVAQGVGVIDPDYRGEITVCLLNTSGEERVVERGQRIAQLVFMPIRRSRVVACEELSDTARGVGGFGHTGRH